MPKVVHVAKLGGPEHLSIAEVDRAEPGPGEVRFKVEAFALNRADILYITGDHYTELKLPSRIGSEAAGVVDAVGPGVETVKVGDRVSSVPFFTTQSDRHGAQGEFAIVPAEYLAPWPEGYSATEACSVWMQYLTAYFALKTVGRLDRGMAVLITAAASSAGVGAIHTAKALGAPVIATTRTAEKQAFLEKVGADHVIVTRTGTDFAPEIRALTAGRGVDVVFDPISGEFTKDYINGLNWGARVIIYGMLNGLDITIPILPALRSKASVHPYSMFNHVKFPDELREGVGFVMEQISAGRFRPEIDRVFPFEETVEAYKYMQGNTQRGKIVVAVVDSD
jgi:NADPH2:quinone reductase